MTAIPTSGKPDPVQVSVVMPTHNRQEQLGQAIESILGQHCECGFDLIVVNDGSTDSTAEFLDQIAARHSDLVSIIHQPNQGPAIARNEGIDRARGPVIAFIDDDCLAPPDWLAQIVNSLRDSGAAGCGGVTRSGHSANLYGETVDHMVNFFKRNVNVLPHVTSGQSAPFLTSNNAAYSAAWLRRVGGFDRTFTIGAEERDMNERIIAAGGNLLFVSELTMSHNHRSTFGGFLRHQREQGRGSYLLYHRKNSPPAKPIPGFVYVRLLLSPFTAFSFFKALTVTALIVLAHGMIIAGYVEAALNSD